MSPNPPRFEKPFHLARWVAGQLHRHQGASARALYQEHLAAFAEFAMDAGPASALIHKHLRKLEEEGLVISEKGNGKGGPAHWTWVGPIPTDDTGAVAKESLTTEPDAATTDFATVDHDAPEDPPGMPAVTQAEALDVMDDKDSFLALRGRWLYEISEQLPIAGLDLDDEWGRIATSFAQACREQAVRGLRISDLDTKLSVLERLSPIVSDDIGSILDAIGADLKTLGGLTA